nr:ABC transporter [Treponema sp.]
MANLISIKNCRIENSRESVIPELNWSFDEGQAWLVIGPNGGGKADFVNALSGSGLKIVPNSQNATDGALYSSVFGDNVEIVSLERAARLIEEERLNDESEYVEGGVDIGRTGR